MSCTPFKITPEQVDDLLYCARAGETDDLLAYLDELLASSTSASPSSSEDRNQSIGALLEQALDEAENGMLHYASANGHLPTLKLLLPSATLSTILHQNASGNTPLHWAGLNGHLSTVKALVARIDELEEAHPQEAARINVLKHEGEERARRIRREALRRQAARAEAEAQSQEEAEQKARQGEGDEEHVKQTSASTEPTPQDQSRAVQGSNGGADADDDVEPEPLRSLWDIRNRFGRGPTSEAQMNEQEAVVQFLLQHMVTGGAAGAAAAAAEAGQDERAEAREKEEEQVKGEEEALSAKADKLSLSSDLAADERKGS